MISKPLVNRVANSGLITFNLEELYPDHEIVSFDIADYLFKGLMLREKEFRAALKDYDWSQLQDKVLLVYCSTDAIVPVWAQMLVVTYAQPEASEVFIGTEKDYLSKFYAEKIRTLDADKYIDKRIVIKGCSDKPVPISAYADLTAFLRPMAKSIMYGEACSTVPLYKKK